MSLIKMSSTHEYFMLMYQIMHEIVKYDIVQSRTAFSFSTCESVLSSPNSVKKA